jgi:hypothetical protein
MDGWKSGRCEVAGRRNTLLSIPHASSLITR